MFPRKPKESTSIVEKECLHEKNKKTKNTKSLKIHIDLFNYEVLCDVLAKAKKYQHFYFSLRRNQKLNVVKQSRHGM